MNINRNNYEEYFLLYIDNELSATERTQLETFLQTNPDLQIEMDILKDTIFPAENIAFPGKQQLLKEEIPADLQSQMLMHIDNELDASSVSSLKQKIESDIVLQKEFLLLQQTKLDASEKIIFTDKASLYRKEPARVVGFYLRRFSAAAVLLGVLFTAGYFLLENKNDSSSNNVVVADKTKNVIGAENNKAIVQEQVNTDPSLTAAVIPSDKKIETASHSVIGSNDPAKTNTQQNNVVVNNKNKVDQQKILNPGNNNDQLTVQQPKNNIPEKKIQFNDQEIKPQLANNAAPSQKQDATYTDNDLTTRENNNALMASLNDDESNKLMYIDEEKITRSKFGGFIKKVKRVVERNAKIKTGNLHIGGFDVALK